MRYPCPRAGELSSDNDTLESLMQSFSIDLRNKLKSDASSGKKPEKTYSKLKIIKICISKYFLNYFYFKN